LKGPTLSFVENKSQQPFSVKGQRINTFGFACKSFLLCFSESVLSDPLCQFISQIPQEPSRKRKSLLRVMGRAILVITVCLAQAGGGNGAGDKGNAVNTLALLNFSLSKSNYKVISIFLTMEIIKCRRDKKPHEILLRLSSLRRSYNEKGMW